MSEISSLCLCIAYLIVGVNLLSVFVPQKRTKKVLSLVLGTVILLTLISAVKDMVTELDHYDISYREYDAPQVDQNAYEALVAQKTTDHLIDSLNELLQLEGICADNISLALKITEEGRIYVSDVNIYISKEYEPKIAQIKNIVYRNASKEPDVYVDGKKAV